MNIPISFFQQEIQLENDRALLRRRTTDDFKGTLDIALDARIWRWYPAAILTKEDLMAHFQDTELRQQAHDRYTFTIIDKRDGKIAGSTSIKEISERDKCLEIGWTWLGVNYQGTGLNKACKSLLLHFVFEGLGFERVELKADALNQPSVRAMEGIGAVREGVLRSRRLVQQGRRRDTVFYSILKSEWPKVKQEIFGK